MNIRIDVPMPTVETVRERIYQVLQCLDLAAEGVVAAYLSLEGHASLTVCPLCRVDDFCHVEGCSHMPQVQVSHKEQLL